MERAWQLVWTLDKAKAFDRLLTKCPSYRLPEILCKWIASFLTGRSENVAIDSFCSERWRSPKMLSPTLFLLHMLKDSNIHCYADDSPVDAFCFGRASVSRENDDQCRNKLVSSVEASLGNVFLWGERNLIHLSYRQWKCADTGCDCKGNVLKDWRYYFYNFVILFICHINIMNFHFSDWRKMAKRNNFSKYYLSFLTVFGRYGKTNLWFSTLIMGDYAEYKTMVNWYITYTISL